jgi:hypothetical protein
VLATLHLYTTLDLSSCVALLIYFTYIVHFANIPFINVPAPLYSFCITPPSPSRFVMVTARICLKPSFTGFTVSYTFNGFKFFCMTKISSKRKEINIFKAKCRILLSGINCFVYNTPVMCHVRSLILHNEITVGYLSCGRLF